MGAGHAPIMGAGAGQSAAASSSHSDMHSSQSKPKQWPLHTRMPGFKPPAQAASGANSRQHASTAAELPACGQGSSGTAQQLVSLAPGYTAARNLARASIAAMAVQKQHAQHKPCSTALGTNHGIKQEINDSSKPRVVRSNGAPSTAVPGKNIGVARAATQSTALGHPNAQGTGTAATPAATSAASTAHARTSHARTGAAHPGNSKGKGRLVLSSSSGTSGCTHTSNNSASQGAASGMHHSDISESEMEDIRRCFSPASQSSTMTDTTLTTSPETEDEAYGTSSVSSGTDGAMVTAVSKRTPRAEPISRFPILASQETPAKTDHPQEDLLLNNNSTPQTVRHMRGHSSSPLLAQLPHDTNTTQPDFPADTHPQQPEPHKSNPPPAHPHSTTIPPPNAQQAQAVHPRLVCLPVCQPPVHGVPSTSVRPLVSLRSELFIY